MLWKVESEFIMELRSKMYSLKKNYREIMTRNTRRYIILDEQDWKLVKDIMWFEKGGVAISSIGIPLLSYLKLTEEQVTNHKAFDFRRVR